ncbi:MAG: type I methionyl aminopeptidase [Saprospiraceae bacterium]|jgi:methionyl aminopeptidase|nr:type I methionyl aminopeptidase [Saprospiraceae bacterium]MBK6817035.1 type I methionyl aminopeptidase [Saprospiraceae bacterium]MBK7435938.1 type I methionyl aminopeptidase [Saprospiraceae bacterium]MBK8281631.1 type I methionyl aminopeptidase [Saprospiraceae bacterium]MBK9680799.1 type I methionyl aminopeptidase [Saprospiraceae bacterium]
MAKGKVNLKTEEEIDLIRQSCQLACEAIAESIKILKPGTSGKDLDLVAQDYIVSKGGYPSFKGYGSPPFPTSLCISVNAAVVHGIPTSVAFKEGDVISLDCGAYLNGYHGDVAYTVVLGEVSAPVMDLCVSTKKSLYLAIDQAIQGNRLGDIGFAVQNYIEKEKKFGVVRELVGHGIGKELHEAPDVSNYGKRGNGLLLHEGMVFAIEPMVNLGTRQIKTLSDNWTIVSKDGKPSAHYEHTIVVRKQKAEILTNHEVMEEAIKNNKELSEISLKI